MRANYSICAMMPVPEAELDVHFSDKRNNTHYLWIDAYPQSFALYLTAKQLRTMHEAIGKYIDIELSSGVQSTADGNAHNVPVEGSIPSPATNSTVNQEICDVCGCSLAHVVGPDVQAALCPVCDADGLQEIA